VSDTRFNPKVLSDIDRQHCQLHAVLQALQNRIKSQDHPDRSLISLLNALATHLQTHFEFEEAEDYFPELTLQAPRFGRRIEQLIAEHREMLEEVGELVEMAKRAFEGKCEMRSIAQGFESLQEKLTAHEHNENELLQIVYTEDIGTHD